ncbi:MAG: magnesium and cobalt transport protein CorA [Thermoleophilia bacterium]|nr:magnesium and cobalt transport protein CorA [Thermoleophilia bacterium]
MQVLTSVDVAAIRSLREQGEFFWLDLVDPEPTAFARRAGEALGWHPLLVEDLEHGFQRPKIDDFGDQTLVITYAARLDGTPGRLELSEHALVVHGDYVVSVRRDEDADITRLRELLAASGEPITEGSIVHRIVDVVVDTTTSASANIAHQVEQLERSIDSDRIDREAVLLQLRACRRDLIELRGVALAQRDALRSLGTSLGEIPGFEVGLRDHFRDVMDHALRVVDEVEVSRLLLDGVFEAYYTMLVAHQGAIAQRLTVISTIFLPLTFVTGFFGQNFGWMVEHVDSRDAFVGWGLGMTLLTALGLLVVFRRLRWF